MIKTSKSDKSKPPIIVSNHKSNYQQLEQQWLERQMYTQDDRGYYV